MPTKSRAVRIIPAHRTLSPREAAALKRRMDAAERRNTRDGYVDPDNPPWTAEQLAKAELRRGPGRPRETDEGTVPCTLRLPVQVVRYFKRGGRGWQTRAVAALTEAMQRGT